MKYIKTILPLLFVLFQITANAQLKGLMNKVKDKAKEQATNTTIKKTENNGNNQSTTTENTNGTGTTTSNNNATTTTNNTNTVKENITTAVKGQETLWQIPGGDGFNEPSKFGDTYDMIVRYNSPFKPYANIRKAGETGSFHFARDYPELKAITEPEAKGAKIIFSSTPFKGGAGTITNKFSSADVRIYARLQIDGGTIKDAFKLHESSLKLPVEYWIYPEGGDAIKEARGRCQVYLNEAKVDKSSIDLDIKPSVDNITLHNDPKDNYAYYIPLFGLLHTNEFFPKSGNYKVAVKITVPLTDEWGKLTDKTTEIMGSFDYAFEVKDAKTVMEEGRAVQTAIQTGIKFAPKPLPKEWKMASAATAVASFPVSKYNQQYLAKYPGSTIVKTYLMPTSGSLWRVVMGSDNIIPSYKYCSQWVTFFVKDKSGKCYYHECSLRQDYQGGGSYGGMYLAIFDAEKTYLNCAEMK